MAKELCEDCGRLYEAGPYTHLCPECNKRRKSESAKAHKLNALGNAAYSLQQARKKRKVIGK